MTLDLETQLARYGDALDRAAAPARVIDGEVPLVTVQPRRPRVVALLVAAVVIALVVASFAIVRASTGDDSSAPVKPIDGPDVPSVPVTLDALSRGSWQDLPLGPFEGARQLTSAVWTGKELLVSTWSATGSRADSFSFDPATAEWHQIATPPITKRQAPVSVWTGSRWIIWGGTTFPGGDVAATEVAADGAMYDPTTDTWSSIPAAPLGGRSQAAGVWTGRELVVAGGIHGCTTGGPCGFGTSPEWSTDAMAYDPAADTWRVTAVAPAPVPQDIGTAGRWMWDGHRAVFVGGAVGTLNTDNLALSYDPAADAWSSQDFPGHVASLTMLGEDLYGASIPALTLGGSTSTIDAVRRVSATAPFAAVAQPLTTSQCWAQIQAVAEGAMVFDCGNSDLARVNQTMTNGQSGSQVTVAPPGSSTDSLYGFDAHTGQWVELPAIRSQAITMIWTDRGLLALGTGWFAELSP